MYAAQNARALSAGQSRLDSMESPEYWLDDEVDEEDDTDADSDSDGDEVQRQELSHV